MVDGFSRLFASSSVFDCSPPPPRTDSLSHSLTHSLTYSLTHYIAQCTECWFSNPPTPTLPITSNHEPESAIQEHNPAEIRECGARLYGRAVLVSGRGAQARVHLEDLFSRRFSSGHVSQELLWCGVCYGVLRRSRTDGIRNAVDFIV
jgi:hypothetical protein